MVEELLSRSGALGKETAKGIADAAMLEVASISMGHMVGLANYARAHGRGGQSFMSHMVGPAHHL